MSIAGRNRSRIVAVALVFLIVAIALGPVSSVAAKRAGKRKPYKVSGQSLGPGPATHYAFIFTCPEIPPTSGVAGSVIEVPSAYSNGKNVVSVVGTSTGLGGPWYVSFYSYSCDQGDLLVDSPATVPAGTGFIVVEQLTEANGTFELMIRPN